MPPLKMNPREFEEIARKALADLPPEFLPYMRDVVLAVEPFASDELLDSLGVPDDEDLMGLYEGPSLAERGGNAAAEMPARITLYYEPILDVCETEEELVQEIQTTVLHELGHHFGMDEDKLGELGYE